MARHTKICIPIIRLASCGALVLGPAQLAEAVPLRCSHRPLLLAAAASDSSKTAATNPTVSTGTTNDAAAQVTALKQEQTQLRRMREAIKRARCAGLDIIGECTQPVEMAGEIDVIGDDFIPIMPATSEGFAQNYIPPGPKYIKLHMAQLAAMIPILQDDIDKMAIPDSEKSFAQHPMQDVDGYMGDIKQHYKKLKSLTKSGDYDQVALINEARGIDASCKGIDAARKKLLHEEGQTERKEEKLERSQEKK